MDKDECICLCEHEVQPVRLCFNNTGASSVPHALVRTCGVGVFEALRHGAWNKALPTVSINILYAGAKAIEDRFCTMPPLAMSKNIAVHAHSGSSRQGIQSCSADVCNIILEVQPKLFELHFTNSDERVSCGP